MGSTFVPAWRHPLRPVRAQRESACAEACIRRRRIGGNAETCRDVREWLSAGVERGRLGPSSTGSERPVADRLGGRGRRANRWPLLGLLGDSWR